MNNDERMKEIEESINSHNTKTGDPLEWGYIVGETPWLLTRVKTLTSALGLAKDALKTVQERMEEDPYRKEPRVTATSAGIASVLCTVDQALANGEEK